MTELNIRESRRLSQIEQGHRSGTGDDIDVVSGVAVPGSRQKSSQETLGMPTLSRVNGEASVGSSPGDQASHDRTQADRPLSRRDDKVEELYMYHVCPDVKLALGRSKSLGVG